VWIARRRWCIPSFTSAASVADKHMLPDLLHGEERKVWGDGGYQGQTEAIRAAAPKAQDMTCRRTRYKNHVDEEAKRKNTTKARVRAKVEHPFRILKRVFGFTRVRYRGIWKNHQWRYGGHAAHRQDTLGDCCTKRYYEVSFTPSFAAIGFIYWYR
jgi:IS5 family transposase